jgi:hypothetical protein
MSFLDKIKGMFEEKKPLVQNKVEEAKGLVTKPDDDDVHANLNFVDPTEFEDKTHTLYRRGENE